MTWDVSLQRTLRHGPARFVLDVRFASAAPRVALLGPSGAGKSQTLRMVAGIARPDAGRVAVAGRVLTDTAQGVAVPPQARRLGLVFQDYALLPHLTVRQNVGFGLLRGWRNPPRGARLPAVTRWLGTLGLTAVADQYPHQISGGQRQRTALARALVTEPAALLLDEPLAALDAGLRQRLREELRALLAELALPLLLVTHDEKDVNRLADAVIHLDAGQVIHPAPPCPADPDATP